MDELIERQAAIDAIWDGTNYDIYTREVKEILEELPSAQPEQKTGKWIKQVDESINAWWYECSECSDYPSKDLYGHDDLSKYCPHCGAKMEE